MRGVVAQPYRAPRSPYRGYRDEAGPEVQTMKITLHVSIGLSGCTRTKTFEVADDCSDDEIDEIAREAMFELVQWHWKRAQ
jgi:hypothetical protein